MASCSGATPPIERKLPNAHSDHNHTRPSFSPAHQFTDDFEGARADAEQNRRPLLLIMTAVWCEACKILENEVLAHPNLQATMAKLTVATVDIENAKAEDAYRRFPVSLWPTVILVNPFDETALSRLSGFVPLSQLRTFLETGILAFEEFLQRSSDAPAEVFVRIRQGRSLCLNGEYEAGAREFDRARSALPVDAPLYATVLRLEVESRNAAGNFETCVHLAPLSAALTSQSVPVILSSAACAAHVDSVLREKFYEKAKGALTAVAGGTVPEVSNEDRSRAFRILEDRARAEGDASTRASLLERHLAFLAAVPALSSEWNGLLPIEDDRIYVYSACGENRSLEALYKTWNDAHPNDGRALYYLAKIAFDARALQRAAELADTAFQHTADPTRLEVMWLLYHIFGAMKDRDRQADVRRTMAEYIEMLPRAVFTSEQLRRTQDMIKEIKEPQGEE